MLRAEGDAKPTTFLPGGKEGGSPPLRNRNPRPEWICQRHLKPSHLWRVKRAHSGEGASRSSSIARRPTQRR